MKKNTDVVLHIRFKAIALKVLRELAERKGLDLSSYVRSLVLTSPEFTKENK